MNQTLLVGRITNDLKLEELDDGKKFCNITLATPRSYKNDKGKYDTDFITCKVWGSIAESTVEYCNKGDLIGIKGRIQSNSYEDKETGKNKIDISVVVDRVSFMSSTKTKNEPEIER